MKLTLDEALYWQWKPEPRGVRQSLKDKVGRKDQSKLYSQTGEDCPGRENLQPRQAVWGAAAAVQMQGKAARALGPLVRANEPPVSSSSKRPWETKGQLRIKNDLIKWLRAWVGHGLGRLYPRVHRWRGAAAWQWNWDPAELMFCPRRWALVWFLRLWASIVTPLVWALQAGTGCVFTRGSRNV